MEVILKRKIDEFLIDWKNKIGHNPLIVKGARQIGKTKSIKLFADANYESVISINFIEEPKYRSIFENGYDTNSVVKNISLINPTFRFIPGKTLIFFDELQAYPDCSTSLKFFKEDGRFDVICSGSLMGINYKQIESNSVGSKTDYEMYSLDFEEFLWANGYDNIFINDLYKHMIELKPFSELQMNTLMTLFREYCILGGMPAVVKMYIENGNFSGTLDLQRQLLKDYEEDITKYATGFDKGKILNVYRHIPVNLAKENKKFQITKVTRGASSREYIGAKEWLDDAGIINVCYCLNFPELPLGGNYQDNIYKIYFRDTGLLTASLDDESQDDIRVNKNLGVYKGALYENIVGDMLVKQGYKLYYYKRQDSTLEQDFFIRSRNYLIPIEVKANNGNSKSMNILIKNTNYSDIKFGMQLCNKNIAFDDSSKKLVFPYFLTFLLKRYVKEKDNENFFETLIS
jgi:predicted AAA+ superfamily ATPase